MADEEYDFVIVGGGTAGLTLAARLTENPKISVAVFEAGEDHTEDDTINILGRHLETFCNPKYDWDFKTVKQCEPFACDRRYHWARGKGLGGSTATNFGMYNQCSRGDLENWEALGNPGWGWDAVEPYFRKHETFHVPDAEITKKMSGQFWDPAIRGNDGPIHLSLCETDLNWCQELWPRTALNAGYPEVPDPRTGSCIGGFNTVCTAVPGDRTRSYAANGYWTPHRHRPNLHVVPNARVRRVTFEECSAARPKAGGILVEVGNATKNVRAIREVVVCAGAILSPQILELSGVGSKDRLDRLGVDCVVANDAVGENLQDHLMFVPCYVVKDGVSTAEHLLRDQKAAAAALEQYHNSKTGPISNASCCTGFVTLPLLTGNSDTSNTILNGVASMPDLDAAPYTSPSIHEQRTLISDQLRKRTEAITQVIVTPVGIDPDASDDAQAFYNHSHPFNGLVSFALNICHPFSRGSVHAAKADIEHAPVIDPRYLSHPFDTEIAGHCLLHGQSLSEVEPLASNIQNDGEHKLQPYKFRRARNLQEAKEDAPKYGFTTWHPIGTCAMMPLEKGGVVDSSCRVYGTQGLRVVDASIFPLHVQGNIMSLVYAVAEKMAETIKHKYAV